MPPPPTPVAMAQPPRSGLASTEPDSNYYDYIKDVDENLNCSICRCPFVEPVICDIGEHVFCRPCIIRALEVSPTCPIDRAPLAVSLLSPAPRLIQQMLDELVVACPHTALGCKHTSQRHLLAAHIKDECSWSETGCACSRECGRKIRKRDMERHLRECPHRIEPCLECGGKVKAIDAETHHSRCPAGSAPCQHCDLSLPRALLASHFLTCPSQPIPCPHARFGCAFTGPRRLVDDDHLLTCPYEGIKDFFIRYEERLDALDYENRNLRTKLEESERRNGDVRDVAEACRNSLGPYYYPPLPLPVSTSRRPAGSLLGVHSPTESGFFSARDSTGTSFDGIDIVSHAWASPVAGWHVPLPHRPTAVPPSIAPRSSSLTPGAPRLENLVEADSSPEQSPLTLDVEPLAEEEPSPQQQQQQAGDDWQAQDYRPSVPPRVSSRPLPGDARSAFPDSYTPVSAFPSLQPPETPATLHPLSSRSPFRPGTSDGHLALGPGGVGEPDEGPSTSVGRDASSTRPPDGSLTSTLASLAGSLSSLLSHAERAPTSGELAELRATAAAAAHETLRLQDEVSLLRASLHGVRMNVSMMMMDRRGEGPLPHHPARWRNPGNAAGGPGLEHEIEPEDLLPPPPQPGPSRLRDMAASLEGRGAWGHPPPGFPGHQIPGSYPWPGYAPFRRFGVGGRPDMKL